MYFVVIIVFSFFAFLGGECFWGRWRGRRFGFVDGALFRVILGARGRRAFLVFGYFCVFVSYRRVVWEFYSWVVRGVRYV